MSTATIDTEFDAIMASNAAGMENVLADNAQARSLSDRIRTAPKALRRWISAVADFFHLSALSEGAASAGARAKGLLVKVLGPVKAVGAFNIVGSLLTCGKGREILTTALATSYKVVTYPVRLLGRALGWLGRKIGLGSTVDRIRAAHTNGEEFIAGKYQAAMTWLDEREQHGAMRWGRSVYQGNVKFNLVKRFAPEGLRTPLHIASLFVPNVGVHGYESAVTIAKEQFLGSNDPASAAEGKNIVEMPQTQTAPAPAVEVVEKLEVVLVGTGAKRKILRITEPNGHVYYRFNGKVYGEGELPEHITLVTPETVAATVPAPPLNRAARREMVRNGQAISE